jgi:hypothetical protein
MRFACSSSADQNQVARRFQGRAGVPLPHQRLVDRGGLVLEVIQALAKGPGVLLGSGLDAETAPQGVSIANGFTAGHLEAPGLSDLAVKGGT